MNKVINLLEKELERQSILRKANEVNEQIANNRPYFGQQTGHNPFLNSHLFEDEIREAIYILKMKL